MTVQHNSLTLRNLECFSQTYYRTYKNNSPHIIKNLKVIFNLQLTEFLNFRVYFQVFPILSKEPVVGQLQTFCILSPFLIQLDLLPTNLQFSMTSSS